MTAWRATSFPPTLQTWLVIIRSDTELILVIELIYILLNIIGCFMLEENWIEISQETIKINFILTNDFMEKYRLYFTIEKTKLQKSIRTNNRGLVIRVAVSSKLTEKYFNIYSCPELTTN